MAHIGLTQKQSGSYYTPGAVAEALVRWAARSSDDRLLDPSCGDGRFIALHHNSVGIEQDPGAAGAAIAQAPWALVHEGDFFAWASNTSERFECAVGNPPFIRYQTFSGATRERALRLCTELGASFNGLTSSWAPFLVAAANLLSSGGRMAFVVPAEIGHAPYAAPLLEYLVEHFDLVHVVAVREKLFPELSEDCWLLYASGFGGRTSEIRFSMVGVLNPTSTPPGKFSRVSVDTWRSTWNRRLRPYLLDATARDLYSQTVADSATKRFGDLARIGIGYVTGANDFFHLRPSEAEQWQIPKAVLQPTVRNGRVLPPQRLTVSTVDRWRRNDESILLLRLPKTAEIPAAVRRYLESEAGQSARGAYKCRVREPWYSVPDVQIPDFFLTYMSGLDVGLVRNDARCTCTNSVHIVRARDGKALARLGEIWGSRFVRLSCELEGHPLGGGMLKLEPGEAARIALPTTETASGLSDEVIEEAIKTLRQWRHCATP